MRAQRVFIFLCSFILTAAAAHAQTVAVGGVVKDTSGAVLPGVTVEAGSPVLIEKVRTTVTDSEGRYLITDLRPGAYSVTFTLPGFNTLKRDGVVLTTGFTATVNADLAVGQVEETVTVSGAAPVVDVSNVRSQSVLTQDTLNELPTARTARGYATALLPGANIGATSQDVGGNKGDAATSIQIHGNRSGDMVMTQDGMRMNNMEGTGGGARIFATNVGSMQEMTLETSGISAEAETGGVQMNVVPKEGANTFSGYFTTNFANGDLQGTNVDQELRDRGLTTAILKVKKIYDINGALGGPIKQNKLWFFTAHRGWGTSTPRPSPGDYYNKNAGTNRYFIYEPDLSRPHYADVPRRSYNLRLTWQASAKNKVNIVHDRQPGCNCPQIYAGLNTPEAMGRHQYIPQHLTQGTWNFPVTNKLLLEGGAGYYLLTIDYLENIGVSLNDISTMDLSTGTQLNARATTIRGGDSYGDNIHHNYNSRFAMSYITGSHAFKAGMFTMWGSRNQTGRIHGDVSYQFLNNAPSSIIQWSTPAVNNTGVVNSGLYAQDQWTINKMTLNLGVRFDYLNAWVPAQTVGAGRWLPARTYDPVKNVPNFKDISPRIGMAYDVFGDGKTAVKVSVGRYVAAIINSLAVANNPSNTEVTSTTRIWADANGDLFPQEGELGASSNAAFGTRRITTTSAPDTLTGFGNRDYNWQTSVALQHQLMTGVALNVGYYRTWYGNFSVTDNTLIGPGDFDPYCVTAPTDSRLGDVSGSRICGLADLRPALFGLVLNENVHSEKFGKQTEHYNGVDVSITGRLPHGAQLSGGVSTGQTTTNSCEVGQMAEQVNGVLNNADSPDRRFCEQTNPFSGQTQFKLYAIHPLPYGFSASATYQNLPGIPVAADAVFTNAQIAPSLGRNLGSCRGAATCTGTATVLLTEPFSNFENRITQLDFRIARTFAIGKTRVQGQFDIFNALNANPILSAGTRYGTAWLRPTEILAARIMKFGVQVNF